MKTMIHTKWTSLRSLRLVVGALTVLFSTSAHAVYLGVLLKSRATTSISGKMVWVCTYEVFGQHVEVVQERMCETTKQFK